MPIKMVTGQHRASPDAYELLAILVLVAAAVPMVYGIGCFVRAYIDYRRRERTRGPDRQITHSELGFLACREGLWEGMAAGVQGPITILMAGSDSGPDSKLVTTAKRVLDKVEEYRTLAVDRLIEEELQATLRPADRPPIPHGAFKLYAIQCLWEDSPNRFALEFSLEGDPDGVWRVEFEDDRPVATGRDD